MSALLYAACCHAKIPARVPMLAVLLQYCMRVACIWGSWCLPWAVLWRIPACDFAKLVSWRENNYEVQVGSQAVRCDLESVK